MKLPIPSNPLKWANSHIPRNQVQLEAEIKNLLKLVFWAALIAPMILIPAYYILVSFGLAPQILLPH